MDDIATIIDILVSHPPEEAIAMMSAILVSCCFHLPDPEDALLMAVDCMKHALDEELEREQQELPEGNVIKLFK